MIELGVNIDHVATLRQARREAYPSVVEAARVAEEAGAHQITVHLRQDRRHIQDHDIEELAQSLRVRMNFEMAAVPEMGVKAELRARDRLNAVGGAQYVGELTDEIPTLAHCESHARIVLDMAQRRRALEAFHTASGRLMAGDPLMAVQSDVSRSLTLAARSPRLWAGLVVLGFGARDCATWVKS